MSEQQRPLAKYHQRIPEAHRSLGWRVQFTSLGTTMVGGLTLHKARLTNGARGRPRYVDSGYLETEEAAVDDAIQKLMRLEPLE